MLLAIGLFFYYGTNTQHPSLRNRWARQSLWDQRGSNLPQRRRHRWSLRSRKRLLSTWNGSCTVSWTMSPRIVASQPGLLATPWRCHRWRRQLGWMMLSMMWWWAMPLSSATRFLDWLHLSYAGITVFVGHSSITTGYTCHLLGSMSLWDTLQSRLVTLVICWDQCHCGTLFNPDWLHLSFAGINVLHLGGPSIPLSVFHPGFIKAVTVS